MLPIGKNNFLFDKKNASIAMLKKPMCQKTIQQGGK
jgi:hypothetical protein